MPVEISQNTTDDALSSLVGILRTFTKNQEELLYIADYVVERKSHMDDRREQTRMIIQRTFSNVPSEKFDEGWEILDEARSRYINSQKENEEDAGSVVAATTVTAASGDSKINPSASSQTTDAATKMGDAAASGDEPAPFADTVESKDDDSVEGDQLDDFVASLPEHCAYEYVVEINRGIVRNRRHSPRIFSSLLTGVVGDFEVLVAHLLKLSILRAPNLIESSERTYTWADVSAFDSLEKFKVAQIDKMIDGVLYGSFQSWLDYLNKKFSIAAAPLASNPQTKEIFLRRNVVVHNGGLVSQQYLDGIGSSSGARLGQPLPVDVDYLRRASDTMLVVGATLVFSAASRFVKDERSRRAMEESIAGGLIYSLLEARRYWAVQEIVKSLDLDKFKNRGAALRAQVNGWLALKRLDRFNECESEVSAWDTDVLEPVFKLAKAALLDDFEYAEGLASMLRGTPDLPIHHYLSWPLLDELREYERQKGQREEAC